MTDETKKISWKKIWSFIKSKIFIAIIIIGLIAISAYQCSRIEELKRQQDVREQNIIALNDSINYVKKKNGELEASKAIFISSIKDLENLNNDLYKKVKAADGTIITLNDAVIRLVQDSLTLAKALDQKDKIIAKLIEIDDHTYMAAWTLPYKYDSLNYDIFYGKTYIGVLNKDPLELAHIDTKIIKRVSQIDITFGERVVKGEYQVYISSAYPGFTIKSLNGFMTDPNDNKYIKSLIKKEHWFQGFSVGLGATGGFNITTGNYGLVIGPSII